jgi:hypothetical protein
LVDDAELEALTNKIKVDWYNPLDRKKCKLVVLYKYEDQNSLAVHKWDGTDENSEVW